MGGGGGEGKSGEDAVEEEGVGGVWYGTWNGVGVAAAELEKALLDNAGKGDDHRGWAAELGRFEIDAATADAASESCNESLPGHAWASRCPCGGAQLEMRRRWAAMHGDA